jgi:hypothetical protein
MAESEWGINCIIILVFIYVEILIVRERGENMMDDTRGTYLPVYVATENNYFSQGWSFSLRSYLRMSLAAILPYP